MPKKNNRSRKNTGWAKTKSYPHERHPATYRRKSAGSDDIEYITFTHSPAVELKGGKTERTVPMLDNVSPAERKKNKAEGQEVRGKPFLCLSESICRETFCITERKRRI